MAVREFTDSTGTSWRVWDTIPRRGQLLRPEYTHGWLTFESELGRYRLAPVLSGWEEFPVPKLEALCRTARAGARGRAEETEADRRAGP